MCTAVAEFRIFLLSYFKILQMTVKQVEVYQKVTFGLVPARQMLKAAQW